jgi:ribosomal protein S18 acetylase RimI-like enzyme
MASLVGIPIAEGLWFRSATVDGTLPVITLWKACHLVRPWNDPAEDICFFLQSPASELLLAFEGDEIVGSIMMGNDGHRGWVYYLGVLPAWRRGGIARPLMVQAEQWMCARGVPKMHAMIRHDNLEIRSFYTALGYADDNVLVVEKSLNGQSKT